MKKMATFAEKVVQSHAITATSSNDKWTVLKLSILSLLFGTGSWIALTGLWLEMPLLLQQLPEGWSLASHLNLMIQLANVGPLLYWLLSYRFKLINDISATHIQIWIGLISCLMLIGFWNQTFMVFGSERSLMLLIFTFGLSLVDCTSSVTFLPFMSRFDLRYMTPYLVGEGLSGFIPSVIVLIQGVGDHRQQPNEADCPPNNITELFNARGVIDEKILIQPRFSVETFFKSLFITLIISYLAFLGLNYLPIAKQERKKVRDLSLERNFNRRKSFLGSLSSSIDNLEKNSDSINQRTYYYMLGLIFWNCFTTFGFMPPLQPFSALPYSTETLHYVVILASLSYPAGCFYAMLIEHRSLRWITFLSAVSTILAMYITFCSWLSPSPPLVGTGWHSIGAWIMVICWILFVTIASYAKTMITLIICDHKRKIGMFWVGMLTQFGGALGALLIFSLINYTNLFNQCPIDY